MFETKHIIKRYALEPRFWPRALRLRIGVLADLHAGWPRVPQSRIRRVVDDLNALEADIIVMLGDYRSNLCFRKPVISLDVVADELARLDAPLGVYGILGNHDWLDDPAAQKRKSGPCEAAEVYRARGLDILENEMRVIDGRFQLVGLGDQYAFGKRAGDGVDDLDLAFSQVRHELPTILLAHEPDIFETLSGEIALTLSGHTHGGQIAPFGLTPVTASRYGSKYIYGHKMRGDRDLIVSAGIGYSGLPLRWNRPSEITLVELS